jgi:hypothetical protein
VNETKPRERKITMKSLKKILTSVVGVLALMWAVSPAYAATSVSDEMQVFLSDGTRVADIVAIEGSEGGTALYQFDSNYSNGNLMGHWIEILDSQGYISDVVGVASADGTFNAGTNVFGYLSDTNGTGLTAAQIAKYFNQANPDAIFTEGFNGITVDISGYINQSKAPNGSASFFSDGAPDGGATVSLLGLALVGIQYLRRKFKTA